MPDPPIRPTAPTRPGDLANPQRTSGSIETSAELLVDRKGDDPDRRPCANWTLANHGCKSDSQLYR